MGDQHGDIWRQKHCVGAPRFLHGRLSLSLTCSPPARRYTGAPLFLHGHAVGALCAFTAGVAGEGPPDVADERLAEVLQEHAKVIEGFFERFVERRRAGVQ